MKDSRHERFRTFRNWIIFTAAVALLSLGVDLLEDRLQFSMALPLFLPVVLVGFRFSILHGVPLPMQLLRVPLLIANVLLVLIISVFGTFNLEPQAERCFMTVGFIVLLQNLCLRPTPLEAIGVTLAQVLVFNGTLFSGLGSHSPAVVANFSVYVTAIMLLSLYIYAQLDKERRKAWFYSQCDMKRVLELAVVNNELEQLSNTDPLTGIANRRNFMRSLEQFWVQTAMHGQPISLLMLDVDHFKKFNDVLGHAEGDECLCEVAQTMELNVRKGIDLVARYGGEEFIVILPNASAETAYDIGERIRKAIELLPLSSAWPLTASIGVATTNFGPDPDTTEALLYRADMALYQAKAGGRNVTVPANQICQDYANLLEVEKRGSIAAAQAM